MLVVTQGPINTWIATPVPVAYAPTLASVTPSAEALLFVSWGTITADDASVVPTGFTDIPDSAAGGMATEFGISNSTYGAGPTPTFSASVGFGSSRSWRSLVVAVKRSP